MKTWTLVSFTLRETLRTKTMIVGLIISLLYLAIIPMLSANGSDQMGAAVMDSNFGRDFLSFSLSGLNFIGTFMAIFTTLGTVYSEIEKGTILTVVTKPLHRWQIIVGKWAGHVILMVAYTTLMGLALWLSVAVDSHALVWNFFPALALVALNVATMVSLTLAFSVFLPVIANVIFVFIALTFTSNLRILHAIGETSGSSVVGTAAGLLRLLLPVSEVSDLATALLSGTLGSAGSLAGDTSSFTPHNWIFLYELWYIGALVLAASWLFKRKDLK